MLLLFVTPFSSNLLVAVVMEAFAMLSPSSMFVCVDWRAVAAFLLNACLAFAWWHVCLKGIHLPRVPCCLPIVQPSPPATLAFC